MLNRIAASTNTFIPVSFLLLDMLDMKELNKPPTGGIGKAVDLHSVLKVNKQTLKTRSFQEACIFSVVEELAEHFAQWSYSVAFLELSFLPTVRLRSFCKNTKVERFCREMKQLIRQIEANTEFINKRRALVSFLPYDSAAASFLEDEKKGGLSPLSKFVAAVRARAQQRSELLSGSSSSVVVGEHASVFRKKAAKSDEEEERDDDDDDDAKGNGEIVFNSAWLPGTQSRDGNLEKEEPKNKDKRKRKEVERTAVDEDIVEDFVFSSDDDDGSMSDSSAQEEDVKTPEQTSKKLTQDAGEGKKIKKTRRGRKKKPSGHAPQKDVKPSGDAPSKRRKFRKKANKRNRTGQMEEI